MWISRSFRDEICPKDAQDITYAIFEYQQSGVSVCRVGFMSRNYFGPPYLWLSKLIKPTFSTLRNIRGGFVQLMTETENEIAYAEVDEMSQENQRFITYLGFHEDAREFGRILYRWEY